MPTFNVSRNYEVTIDPKQLAICEPELIHEMVSEITRMADVGDEEGTIYRYKDEQGPYWGKEIDGDEEITVFGPIEYSVVETGQQVNGRIVTT